MPVVAAVAVGGFGAGFGVGVAADAVRHRFAAGCGRRSGRRCRSGRTGRRPARPGDRPGSGRPGRCCRAGTRCAVLVTVRCSDHRNASRSWRRGRVAAVGPPACQRRSGACPVSEWIRVVDGLDPGGEQPVQLGQVGDRSPAPSRVTSRRGTARARCGSIVRSSRGPAAGRGWSGSA